jgi:hypothetical protein
MPPRPKWASLKRLLAHLDPPAIRRPGSLAVTEANGEAALIENENEKRNPILWQVVLLQRHEQ